MPFPWLAAAATVKGAIGSLFGEGPQASPELQQVFQMLQNQQSEGLSDEEVAARRRRLGMGLSNEAGALSAVTGSRLARQGASAGAAETAFSRLAGQRLRALGSGLAEIEIADEAQRSADERQRIALLAQLAGQFPGQDATGGGFANLFGAGLQGLLSGNPSVGGFGGGGGSFSNFGRTPARTSPFSGFRG